MRVRENEEERRGWLRRERGGLGGEMKRKMLESMLEGLKGFKKPSVVLEQYPTPAHLAADMIHFADEGFDDIQDKAVLDLGCGCGMLSIAAAVQGASTVTGVDIDHDAIQVFEDNREDVQEICEIGTSPLSLHRSRRLTYSIHKYIYACVCINPALHNSGCPTYDTI